MATQFGTPEAEYRYYESEGFEQSETRCRECGTKQVVWHWPSELPAFVLLKCVSCQCKHLDVLRKIIQQTPS